MPVMCATCPWREGSPYAHLKGYLSDASKNQGRICHSTGESVIKGKTGKAEKLCRGSRNEQLQRFARMGFIRAATDEAWEEKCKALGL